MDALSANTLFLLKKGNFGMKDQQVALQWIQDNIASFGGDPNHVTLFGESAGASSIGLHLMSPKSDSLFHRAILQSGSPDSHWSFMSHDTARSRSTLLFDAVGCSNDENVLQCLRDKPAEDIFNNEWVVGEFLVFPWVPTIDGDFLSESPYNLLQQGSFQKNKNILIGSNKDEGTFWILYSVPGLSKDSPSLLNHTMYLDGVDIIDWDLSENTRNEIKQQYSPLDTNDYSANRDALDDVTGDRSFTCPCVDFADHLAVEVPTYYYYLTHRASTEVWPEWMGVIHGADIQVTCIAISCLMPNSH